MPTSAGVIRARLVFFPASLAFGAVSLLWRRVPAHRQPALPTTGLLLSAACLLACGLLLRDGTDIGVPTMGSSPSPASPWHSPTAPP